MAGLEHLIQDLPDPDFARRFISSLEELHPRDFNKLGKNDGLLSDVLTLAAYSPLLATTMLQNPEYLWWLNRKRSSPSVRTKDELMEALGRFLLTHSNLDLHTQLARFRRRELLRIFLSDIRRLATMAEITEDISNLADAILETALRRAEQDTNNRYGSPLVIDDKGRKTEAGFCIVSLGKLGSRELNYSSDIDLLFLYSGDGETSGTGSRGAVTNREYFIKLSETIVQMVGKQTGEGAAYRVDMRLRPHGRVGPLATSLEDAVRYYLGEARNWERQVLIRSRSSAGDGEIYKRFFDRVESAVFETIPSVQDDSVALSSHDRGTTNARALASVRSSKQLIDQEQKHESGTNVKLGRGGIREIEFIAQALQLAYGGKDRWVRASHTLISLSRLADRGLITEAELTELFNAYEFLRHLEHVLQMENGLQTHTVPDELVRRAIVARRLRCETVETFNAELDKHTGNVHRIFERVFGSEDESQAVPPSVGDVSVDTGSISVDGHSRSSADTGGERVSASAPATGPSSRGDYLAQLSDAIQNESDYRHRLGAFRRRWSELIDNIRTAEIRGSIDMREAKRAQTALAEASIEIALDLTRRELGRRTKKHIDVLPIVVIGLGKLGGGAIDYGSDLDLVLLFNDDANTSMLDDNSPAEFYGRAAEIFVTTLSSMTRDGSIYRVDLRLRPYGKNGQSVMSAAAFVEYMRDSAAIWEWLAYVKIRAVAGDMALGNRIERSVREIIHARAASAERNDLANETRRVRMLLEKEKGGRRRSKDIDIKYGTGGMLDVYFAMRYLQLRDNVPDQSDNRSTDFMLEELHARGSLTSTDHGALLDGYRFLSSLDHNLRLTVGRTTRLPAANQKALDAIAARMGLTSASGLIETLTLHRINVRSAFDNILGAAL